MATFPLLSSPTIRRYVAQSMVEGVERRRKLLILLAGDMQPEPQKPRKPEPLPPVPVIQELIMVRMLVPVQSEECCDSCHRPVSVCGELYSYCGWPYDADDGMEVCDECSDTLSMEE